MDKTKQVKKRKPGRPKGARNICNNDLRSKVQEKMDQFNCDPFESLIRIGMECEADIKAIDDSIKSSKDISPNDQALFHKAKETYRGQAINVYKELAQYIAPKLKSIEHTGDKDRPIDLNWTITVVE